MNVAQTVGRQLVEQGVDHVFGVVGSGNFHVTNALIAAGARFVPAAHEGGAACMADAFARVSGRLTVLTVHQGPGLTNALTGIAEAAKARTPIVVLVPEATNPASNFYVDVQALADSIGAGFVRVQADQVTHDVAAACRLALAGSGQTVLLGLPLDVQDMAASDTEPDAHIVHFAQPRALSSDVDQLVAAIVAARRPVFIAGRGATRNPVARNELVELADRAGALLAVSAAAKGLFEGESWYLDVSGGFATPLAAELIAAADLVVAWGSTLNMWTTRHGQLISAGSTVVQVDLDPNALYLHALSASRNVHIGVTGDVAVVARQCLDAWPSAVGSSGQWRTPELLARIETARRWRDVAYDDDSDAEHIDPRTLTIELDDLLPSQRTVAVDSGNFMGYPSMFLSVPDHHGFCFTQAFQSIGLGLASAVGAAVARPDRLTVAALGDGGFLMSVSELSTIVRLGLRMLIVVYNDAAYGAEVHHFGPHGHPLDTVRFAEADLASIARGFGCAGVTVRGRDDLTAVRDWLADPSTPTLLVDAKVTASQASWWLEEAFRGH